MQNKNYQYIAGLARTLAGTNAENYADDELVIDMNIVREDMHAQIVAKGKSNPYWDEAVLDIIEGENEYLLPGNDDEKPENDRVYAGMRTVKKVFVKYHPDGQYEQLEYRNISEPLGENGSKKYYSIADNSLFIFPTPQTYVEDGIIVHGINTLRPVEKNATEEKIFAKKLPSRAYETLALGIAVRYCRYLKRDFSEAEKLEIEYEKEMNKIVESFKARSVRIFENEPILPRYDLQ